MGQASSPDAYPASRLFMDEAMEGKKGARLRFPTRGKVWQFRANCYSLRFKERQRNKKVYDPASPGHGRTPWDKLSFTLWEDDNGMWVIDAIHTHDYKSEEII